jgi:hypothetical protein
MPPETRASNTPALPCPALTCKSCHVSDPGDRHGAEDHVQRRAAGRAVEVLAACSLRLFVCLFAHQFVCLLVCLVSCFAWCAQSAAASSVAASSVAARSVAARSAAPSSVAASTVAARSVATRSVWLRNEIVALINVLERFSQSIRAVALFRCAARSRLAPLPLSPAPA